MKKQKRKKIKGSRIGKREDWAVVQVAAYIKKPYQTARNYMLQGKFGPVKYDEETRRLSVKASGVRSWIPDDEIPAEKNA